MPLDRWKFAVAVAAIAGCGTTHESSSPTPVTPTPVAPVTAGPPTTPPARAPFRAVLAALPEATAVRVTDAWMGLSPIAPIEHHYDLAIAGDAVTIHSVCRARDREAPQSDTSMSRGELSTWLTRLRTVELTEGDYAPRIDHTDDYPTRTIAIDTPAGAVTFESRSQGRTGEPWKITVGSDVAVVASPIPGEVFAELRRAAQAERCTNWTRTLL